MAWLSLSSQLLTGCASFYTIAEENHSRQYTMPRTIAKEFSLSGRFNITTSDGNQYGNFNWRKELAFEQLTFNTPLGQTVAKITIESGNAVLETADKQYTGQDLQQLMQDKLGFVIPLAYMHYWVQAAVLPNIAVESFAPNGFRQLGWQVAYLDWYDSQHARIIKMTNSTTTIKLFLLWND